MIRYLIGDVFDRMAELEDGSVDLILTSPPFLALRSYLPADHPDKDKEIGSEATPAEFIDTLLALTAEWRRLLAPHGSIAVELGDTYAGSGGAGGDYNPGGWREGQNQWKQAHGYDWKFPGSLEHRTGGGGGPGWPLAKSLTLTPEAYRFALAYGINPHTGQPSPAGQWRIRNVIRWVRPNPPVGALGDKFRPATSELVVACVSGKRWFDLDAVREAHQRWPRDAEAGMYREGAPPGGDNKKQQGDPMNSGGNPAGAPPLDWWKLSPGGYQGAHYAVWPPELCVKPIKTMCPREVCRECGEPRRRIVDHRREFTDDYRDDAPSPGRSHAAQQGGPLAHWSEYTLSRETIGWSDCGHDDYRPGLVLDPFAGTGTTLMVAHGHSRDSIGIDLDPRNADLARDRVGPMFLEVEA